MSEQEKWQTSANGPSLTSQSFGVYAAVAWATETWTRTTPAPTPPVSPGGDS